MRAWMKYPLILLAFLAIVLALNACAGHASADTHTSQASGNAGTAGTWDNGVPSAGDDLVFTGAYNIAMNQAITYGTITLGAGYSGTATAGTVNFGYSSLSVAGGTWTANANYLQTCSGSIVRTAGSITADLLCISMTGDGSSINIPYQAPLKVYINANVTWTTSLGGDFDSLFVSSGRTLTITSWGGVSDVYCGISGRAFYNNGTIVGTGTLGIFSYNYNPTIYLGTVTCLTQVHLHPAAGAGQTVSLGADASIADLTIISDSASQVQTFDLNGHTLTMSSTLSVSTRGALSCGSGGIITIANWDSSTWTGTWIPGTGKVEFNSPYKAIKLGVGQTFYDLQLVNNENVTGATQVTHNLRFTGLMAGKYYTYAYGSTAITRGHLANSSGQVDLGAVTMAVHNLYLMDIYPEITTSPTITSSITDTYRYDANASESVTWTITCSYPDIDVDSNGIVSGYLSNDTPISIKITATDSVGGVTYQNYTLTIHGPQADLIPLTQTLLPLVIGVVLLGVVVSALGTTGLKKGKKKG
jgi:hypothetical protein